jgi:hypothetical protein
VLDFRNKFIILEIGLLKALYFDPLGVLLIKNCNVLCFFVPLFEKKFSFRTGTETTHNQVSRLINWNQTTHNQVIEAN